MFLQCSMPKGIQNYNPLQKETTSRNDNLTTKERFDEETIARQGAKMLTGRKNMY